VVHIFITQLETVKSHLPLTLHRLAHTVLGSVPFAMGIWCVCSVTHVVALSGMRLHCRQTSTQETKADNCASCFRHSLYKKWSSQCAHCQFIWTARIRAQKERGHKQLQADWKTLLHTEKALNLSRDFPVSLRILALGLRVYFFLPCAQRSWTLIITKNIFRVESVEKGTRGYDLLIRRTTRRNIAAL
jgi:hypothetical protein